MTPFPQIHPCPYLDRLDEVIDGGFCRMCRREVHDLTALDARERADFLAVRGGDACVSYRMNVKPVLAAALIAASAAVLAAPDAALAASHHAGRNHHRHRSVHIQTVAVMTAGVPVMPAPDRIPALPIEPPAPDPIPHPPVEPPAPPRIAD
jgi:hypothetical protein